MTGGNDNNVYRVPYNGGAYGSPQLWAAGTGTINYAYGIAGTASQLFVASGLDNTVTEISPMAIVGNE